jgi:hypothetical protein
MRWWRDLWASLREARREAAERRAWRCAQCGDGDVDPWHRRSEKNPSICEMCLHIRLAAEEDRRKRIADLAAMVAGKNPQSTYRDADPHATAAAAWVVAEELYKRERGR